MHIYIIETDFMPGYVGTLFRTHTESCYVAVLKSLLRNPHLLNVILCHTLINYSGLS
jgi:hypothetical protein